MNCPHFKKGKCLNKGLINVGKLLGSVKSEKKAEASRRNGCKGGRKKGSKNKFKNVTFSCCACECDCIESVPIDIYISKKLEKVKHLYTCSECQEAHKNGLVTGTGCEPPKTGVFTYVETGEEVKFDN